MRLENFLRTNRRRVSRELSLLERGRSIAYVGQRPFQIDDEIISRSKESASQPLSAVRSATWFVPRFAHAYAGIFTILRIAEYLAKQGVDTNVVLYDEGGQSIESQRASVERDFPGLRGSHFQRFNFARDDVATLPPSDIGVCTAWESAYLLLGFNQCKRKYYLIQDYEPSFFPAGAKYALAEATYRFGFIGLINTPGLLKVVKQRHDGVVGTSFVPATDRRYFNEERPRRTDAPDAGRVRVVCYTRPTKYRNAFELMVGVIREVSRLLGPDRVEIVTAGEDWSPRRFGVDGLVTNVGLLKSLDEVADLYRSCDIGVVYMLSAHPSYQPFEYMAAGVATVVNRNDANAWFLRDGENCLVAEPSATAMARKVEQLATDPALRERIRVSGQAAVTYEWDTVLADIWTYISEDRGSVVPVSEIRA